MWTMIRFLIPVACVLFPATCVAGGTVSLEDVDPLLRQTPAVRDLLMSSLKLGNTVMAAVRFGPHFGHLSGGRMGPYMIRGGRRGSNGDTTLEIVLCTKARFLDASGKATESAMNAARVEERLTVVMLREANSVPAIPTCPE